MSHALLGDSSAGHRMCATISLLGGGRKCTATAQRPAACLHLLLSAPVGGAAQFAGRQSRPAVEAAVFAGTAQLDKARINGPVAGLGVIDLSERGTMVGVLKHPLEKDVL